MARVCFVVAAASAPSACRYVGGFSLEEAFCRLHRALTGRPDMAAKLFAAKQNLLQDVLQARLSHTFAGFWYLVLMACCYAKII